MLIEATDKKYYDKLMDSPIMRKQSRESNKPKKQIKFNFSTEGKKSDNL